MASPNKYILAVLTICLLSLNLTAKDVTGMISGKVLSSDGEPIDYATVHLKGTRFISELLHYLYSCPQFQFSNFVSDFGM